jgi:EAL domain-containing protein (putative c-di-GMP-specific phosphodiesterase class I)
MGAWVNASAAIALCCGCIYVLRREFHKETDMLRALRSAIRGDQLELYLQPQVNRSGSIVGAEALLRWNHPERGLVPPNEFIPVAEAGGLMPQLGGWVLREACRILATWKNDSALGNLTLAINVSASQFMTDSFERSALDTIRLHGVDPSKLKIEITESVIIAGMQPVVAKMEALKAEGIEFALDDFGTGYSSLSYLRRLPIGQLKIDRSFVQDADESLQGASLAKTIVQMGLDLGLTVLAEGVETESQHRLLGSVGCHQYQGYYFGRPTPREDFETRVRDLSGNDDAVMSINCEQPAHDDQEWQRPSRRKAGSF